MSDWQEWAANEVRVRRVCKRLLTHMAGNTVGGAMSDWADAAREQKLLRRAQEHCGRRWRQLQLREVMSEWVASVNEQKQSDLMTQAQNAAALIMQSQARIKDEMEEAISHRDQVIKRMDARCASEVDRVLQLDCTRQTQARFISGLKLRINDMEKEAEASKEKIAASMFSGGRWQAMYVNMYNKFKESQLQVEQLLKFEPLLESAKADIQVFCCDKVRARSRARARTHTHTHKHYMYIYI